jgi:DNA-binding NarL/FixJ family response regulator
MPGAGNPRNNARAPTAKPRIALAIEDRWRKQGIEAFLNREGFEVGGPRPHLVIADAPRPWRDISEIFLRLHSRFPDTDIVVFVPELRYAYVEPCLRAGALGVLHFNSEPALILRAIEAIRRGNIWAPRNLLARAIRDLSQPPPKSVAAADFSFTRTERRVLGALRDELTNKEIASLLDVSVATVKFHIGHLLRKTHCANRHQLRQLAMRRPF